MFAMQYSHRLPGDCDDLKDWRGVRFWPTSSLTEMAHDVTVYEVPHLAAPGLEQLP